MGYGSSSGYSPSGYGGYGSAYGMGYSNYGGAYGNVVRLPTLVVYGSRDDGFGYGVDFGYFGATQTYFQDSFGGGNYFSSGDPGFVGTDFTQNNSSLTSPFTPGRDPFSGGGFNVQLPPIQRKVQPKFLPTLPGPSGEANFVNNIYESKLAAFEANPNSFEANTWIGENGRTYEIPPASPEFEGTPGEFRSRIEDLVDSFYYKVSFEQALRRYPNDVLENGGFDGFYGENLSSEDFQNLLKDSRYFPQVINQGSETISADGTVITYPDGTSFNVNFDNNGNFSVDTLGGFNIPEGYQGSFTDGAISVQGDSFAENPDSLSNQFVLTLANQGS